MRTLNYDVEEDTFENPTPLGKIEFTNIIATKDLNAPRRLVLACHYDSKYFKRFDFIGMTDSAVPCAMIMDLARVLNDAFNKNRDSKVDVGVGAFNLSFAGTFRLTCFNCLSQASHKMLLPFNFSIGF